MKTTCTLQGTKMQVMEVADGDQTFWVQHFGSAPQGWKSAEGTPARYSQDLIDTLLASGIECHPDKSEAPCTPHATDVAFQPSFTAAV